MQFFGTITILLVFSIATLLFPVCEALDLSTTQNVDPTVTASTQVSSDASTLSTVPLDIPYKDTSDTVGQQVEEIWERGFDPSLLLTYDDRCPTDDVASFPQPKGLATPYNAASLLSACKSYWSCSSLTGAMVQNGKAPMKMRNSWQRGQYDFCKAHCTCEVIDVPAKHCAANFGCLNPQGGWMAGGVGGSASRGESAPVDIGDGLKMQAYHGPARKE